MSKKYSEWFGVGLTIVDNIDTTIIMGLEEGNTNVLIPCLIILDNVSDVS